MFILKLRPHRNNNLLLCVNVPCSLKILLFVVQCFSLFHHIVSVANNKSYYCLLPSRSIQIKDEEKNFFSVYTCF